MARRWTVRFLAWALRHGITVHQAAAAIEQSFAWHDETWRSCLLADAQARNRARIMKAMTG